MDITSLMGGGAWENYVHEDDPLIMCEDCGQDILQSTAHWHTCEVEYHGDGQVPLCDECHRLNAFRDEEE